MTTLPHDDRLLDLLVENATSGLDPRDRAELERGLGSERLVLETELAAAALHLALAPASDPPPDSLRASLAATAAAFTAGLEAAHDAASDHLPRLAPEPPLTTTRTFAASGWLAAAASLALAALIWAARSPAPPPPTLADRYATLSAKPGVLRSAWVGLDDLNLAAPHQYDLDLRGEVLWDPHTQSGYMKFTGLAANDPSVYQYQLWIFDAQRRIGDLPHFAIPGLPEVLTQRPVDGGVFDATPNADGVVIVPINSKLPVGDAALFAITVEPPGGVVVSDRDIVTAAVAG